MASWNNSRFLITATKLALLVLKTLKVVEHVTELHTRGEITVPEGHVFVAEHAAAQMLWKLGASYMAYGAPGTGRSFSAKC